MAFLQLKEKYNMTTKDIDRSIDVQLLAEPDECEAEFNKYKKQVYVVPCKNIGSDYTSAESGSFIIYNEKNFELKCSSYLMGKILPHSKGDCVNIRMISDGERTNYVVSPSKVEYDKPPEEIKTVKESKYGYDSVKERDTDRRLDILWGMAFNNATRLVSNLSTNETVASKVELIEKIMPDMFNISRGLDDVLNQELAKKEENENDLPF